MFRRLMILLPIFLVACGKEKIPFDKDPYFDFLTTRFQKDAKINQVEIGTFNSITVMRFGDKNISEYAHCQIHDLETGYGIFPAFEEVFGISYETDYREIVFREDLKSFTENEQYQIFLHEVGHCAYHLWHSKNPFSIMYYKFNNLDGYLPQAIVNFFQEAKENEPNWGSSDIIPEINEERSIQ